MDVGREHLGRGDRAASPIEALGDVVQSGQDVVLRRLDVLRIEAERRIEGLRDETLGLVAAGLLAFSAWVLLLGAAVVFLSREVGLGWALVILGAANLMLALLVQRGARGRAARAVAGAAAATLQS
jgi:hypothetical protein